MRTTIYIPDELVDEIKQMAWRRKKSVSQYFVDLHRGISVIEDNKNNPPESEKKSVAPQEKFQPIVVGGEVLEKGETIAEKIKELSVRDKYKLKFPNQICPNCKNKNKDCEC